MRRRRATLALILAGVVFVAAGFIESFRLVVHPVSVPLPLAVPLRVVVIADVHLSPWQAQYRQAERAVALANEQRPDLVLLLGDYVNVRNSIPDVARILGKLKARLGVYAVLGNHDHWTDASLMLKELRQNGIRTLVNQQVIIGKGSARVCLAGIDDLSAGKPDLDATLRSAPLGIPLVLLSHNPDVILNPRTQRADLVLAGHTHGGQVWLAGRFIAPVSPWGRRHLAGLYRKGHPRVFVTRGSCLGRTPPRWYCTPEIAVLEVGAPAGRRDV